MKHNAIILMIGAVMLYGCVAPPAPVPPPVAVMAPPPIVAVAAPVVIAPPPPPVMVYHPRVNHVAHPAPRHAAHRRYAMRRYRTTTVIVEPRCGGTQHACNVEHLDVPIQ